MTSRGTAIEKRPRPGPASPSDPEGSAVPCPVCLQLRNREDVFCGRCGSPLTDCPEKPDRGGITDFAPGFLFAGRYRIIEKLGEGGMGKVFKVYDCEVDSTIALKLIRPEIEFRERTLERFKSELKLAREISHGNVCRMFDLKNSEGVYYLTMEYIDGQSLRSMIRMTPRLSLSTVVDIALQIGEGLAQAHKQGIVHRDIKPSNIALDRSGKVRIMDFGLAKTLSGEGGPNRDKVKIAGTPEYMAPEQLDGDEPDPRSDIYSFGVVLFEMVTSRMLFHGDSPLSVAFKHRTEIPPDPRQINGSIPESLSRLILGCLEKDRGKRIGSIGDVVDGLKAIRRELVDKASAIPGRGPDIQPVLRRIYKRWWKVAAAVLILVLAGGAGWINQKGPSSAISPLSPRIVVLPFDTVGEIELDIFAEGLSEEITNRLSSLQGLGVISRTSAKVYKDTDKDVRRIGKELGVDYILAGTVFWEPVADGNLQIQFNPRLIRVADNVRLWSEAYERRPGNDLSVQSEIADRVLTRFLEMFGDLSENQPGDGSSGPTGIARENAGGSG